MTGQEIYQIANYRNIIFVILYYIILYYIILYYIILYYIIHITHRCLGYTFLFQTTLLKISISLNVYFI